MALWTLPNTYGAWEGQFPYAFARHMASNKKFGGAHPGRVAPDGDAIAIASLVLTPYNQDGSFAPGAMCFYSLRTQDGLDPHPGRRPDKSRKELPAASTSSLPPGLGVPSNMPADAPSPMSSFLQSTFPEQPEQHAQGSVQPYTASGLVPQANTAYDWEEEAERRRQLQSAADSRRLMAQADEYRAEWGLPPLAQSGPSQQDKRPRESTSGSSRGNSPGGQQIPGDGRPRASKTGKAVSKDQRMYASPNPQYAAVASRPGSIPPGPDLRFSSRSGSIPPGQDRRIPGRSGSIPPGQDRRSSSRSGSIPPGQDRRSSSRPGYGRAGPGTPGQAPSYSFQQDPAAGSPNPWELDSQFAQDPVWANTNLTRSPGGGRRPRHRSSESPRR